MARLHSMVLTLLGTFGDPHRDRGGQELLSWSKGELLGRQTRWPILLAYRYVSSARSRPYPASRTSSSPGTVAIEPLSDVPNTKVVVTRFRARYSDNVCCVWPLREATSSTRIALESCSKAQYAEMFPWPCQAREAAAMFRREQGMARSAMLVCRSCVDRD